MKIQVELPEDRTRPGQWHVFDDNGIRRFGPSGCLGKSDNAAAAASGDPRRDPERENGDTPFGDYQATLTYEPDTPDFRRSYGETDETGRIPTLLLEPVEGPTQAWRAHLNGRTGLMIHAGDLNGTGGLRPTHGCLRVFQTDLAGVTGALKAFNPGTKVSVSIAGPAGAAIPT